MRAPSRSRSRTRTRRTRRGRATTRSSARALQHEEAHDAERAPRRRGDADLDLALAMTLDEEEAARRDAYEAAGSDDEALARALQSQEDDRHQAFAFDDEALARRLEEEANSNVSGASRRAMKMNDARLAFELERQQHEAMKRAEDDFSVAARVQRELTAREEDERRQHGVASSSRRLD